MTFGLMFVPCALATVAPAMVQGADSLLTKQKTLVKISRYIDRLEANDTEAQIVALAAAIALEEKASALDASRRRSYACSSRSFTIQTPEALPSREGHGPHRQRKIRYTAPIVFADRPTAAVQKLLGGATRSLNHSLLCSLSMTMATSHRVWRFAHG
jgi:hypothetical protein